MNEPIKEWKQYTAGVTYNQQLIINGKGYYEQIDANIAFSNGDQWRNVDAPDIPKPIIPIIQKAKQHTIANLCSTNISANINPLEYNASEQERTPEMEQDIETTEIANAEIRNILDQVKFEFKIRDGLGDAYDTGDMALHWYWETNSKVLKGAKYENYKGKICAELIDGQNIMFGNPNVMDVQRQPYVIVVGREMTETLKKEAKGAKGEITDDLDYEWQASDNGKIELESAGFGKSLYILYYYKKNGKVYVSKCVKNAYIYKDVDTGYTYYPVAFTNYRKNKNTYHGIAQVTGLIPNQIAVNKLCSLIIKSVMDTAFPKLMYNKNIMNTPTNRVGETFALDLQPGENVGNAAQYLNTAQVSAQVIQVIDLIMTYTKDMLGINDAAVGNVTPDNTSAIALAEKLTSVPLENVRSNLYEFVEQCVDIILDMIGTKYGIRPVVIKDGENTKVVEYDFSKLKDLNYNKRIDVGAIGYASELSSLKELKELLNLGAITVVDYLERLPEYQVPERDELVRELKSRLGMVSAKEQQEKEATWEQMMAFMERLPQDIQDQLRTLPDNQLEEQLMVLMQQAPQMQQEQQTAGQEQQINQMLMGGQQ